MKKIIVTTETLQKILDSFATEDEFLEFAGQLGGTIEEIMYASQVSRRNSDNEEIKTVMLMKQLFIFGLFCRENIETIHEMIKAVDYKVMEEGEPEHLNGYDPSPYESN